MLADPWPLPPPEQLPTVLIRNGTVLLTEAATAASPSSATCG